MLSYIIQTGSLLVELAIGLWLYFYILPRIKACPKCGFTIMPDLVKRVDFERMECPKCGEEVSPASGR